MRLRYADLGGRKVNLDAIAWIDFEPEPWNDEILPAMTRAVIVFIGGGRMNLNLPETDLFRDQWLKALAELDPIDLLRQHGVPALFG
jgi:hypothetical protein